MRKCLVLFIILLGLTVVRGQTIEDIADIDLSGLPQPTQVKELHYWFDNKEDNIHVVNELSGNYTLDVSQLIEGLHSIHYQVIGTDNVASYVASAIFLKYGTESTEVTAKKLMYWYDNEETVNTEDFTNDIQILDASHLIDGLHTIHYQVLCNNSMMTPSKSSIFLRISSEAGVPTAKSVCYWFDDDESSMKVTDITSGTQQLDVSNLMTGLHTIHYQLIDSNDKACPPVTGIFLKKYMKVTENLNNTITEYRYWYNNNYTDIQTVTIDNPTVSYQLISLLPVSREPIRSSSFHFELTDNMPVIYAKNDFHVRFHDIQGSFTDAEKSFVDYRVKQTLTNIELLESGVHTTDKPTDNVIKWYKLEAEPGDSLQFKIDHAATIQLFSPSGEEIHQVSGAESVKWNGLHVWENGTYYLALHDVTAQQGTTISIDYNHIDKYAVLRQDVSVVGNGGCSTITFEGNGFRDLYAVDLFTAQGDTLKSVYIGHESDATTSVVFDFSDALINQYHALFHFTEEDKLFADLISVEEAVDITTESSVEYPRVFLSGRTITYAIKVSNKGNSTAYHMPIYMYIKGDIIGKIDIKGLDLKSVFSEIDKDGITAEELNELSIIEESIGANHYFIDTKIYDEAIRDSQCVKAACFFVDIPPYTEKTIYVSMQPNMQVELKYMIPNSMSPLVTETESNGQLKIKRKDFQQTYCCWRDQIECVLSIVSDISGFADFILSFDPSCTAGSIAAISNCLVGIVNKVVRSVDNSVCGNMDHGMSDIYEDFKSIGNGFSLFGSIASCLTKVLPWEKAVTIIKGINTGVGIIGGGVSGFTTLTDCTVAFVEMFDNFKCPSTPLIGGGSSYHTIAYDPNDIYGYIAESGSKAVKNGLRDVYYTIEFENDPEFATAAAHDIVVTNQLDADKFDLSTFTPTQIKIGSRSAELNGDKNFVTTIDMRPEINAIAEVTGTFDETTGLAKWFIKSLDPMTMEPTNEPMDGVLPVNANGNGIGEVSFDIALKPDLPHGTEVPNQASIVFDTNEPIMTPVWKNVVDKIAPESHIINVEQQDESTATISIEATDELSGPWRYDVYVQYGIGSAWVKAVENVPVETTATVVVYDGIIHGFYVVVTDSAGNVEQKEPIREYVLNLSDIVMGDININGGIDIGDAVCIVNYIVGKPNAVFNTAAADTNKDGRIDIGDAVTIVNYLVGKTESLAPLLLMEEEFSNLRDPE